MNTDIPHPDALIQNLFQTADIIFWLEWNKITLQFGRCVQVDGCPWGKNHTY